MKHSIIAAALLMAAIAPTLVGAEDAKLFDVGHERQLMVDRLFIEQPVNVQLRLHPARKTGQIVLRPEHPWESK